METRTDPFRCETVILSNVLFTSHGFKSEWHATESINQIFAAGYNSSHELRQKFPHFNLFGWDPDHFKEPQIGSTQVSTNVLSHRIQTVVIKLIYHRTSSLDPKSFDAIPVVFIDLERELPAEADAEVAPQTVIEGAKWKVIRLRSYVSPSNLNKIITYDLSS